MTSASPASAPPLRTADDVLERVDALIGRACVARRLWILLIDGDDRQAPVLPQIDDLPRAPDPVGLRSLGRMLAALQDQVAPDGTASVVLVLERLGRHGVLPLDRRWAAALRTVCDGADVALRGLYLSTDGGVRALE